MIASRAAAVSVDNRADSDRPSSRTWTFTDPKCSGCSRKLIDPPSELMRLKLRAIRWITRTRSCCDKLGSVAFSCELDFAVWLPTERDGAALIALVDSVLDVEVAVGIGVAALTPF